MRFFAIWSFVAALAAQPALADAPLRLQPLERQLAAITALNPNVGVAALDLATGEMVSVHGDEPFPMASTVKVAIAVNYLAQVEHGRRSLTDRIGGRSADQLMQAMLIRSDNHATDLLLGNLGGPRTVQNWLDQHGIANLRIDRTIAQLLRARRDLHDIRDSSTPRAMVDLLRRIDKGALLNPASRRYLLGTMAKCTTGRNRMKALLPAGTRVEHKTGTLSGYTSDVGFITLPDGRRLAVALFARSSGNRARTIAEAARAIYHGFADAFRYPFVAAAPGAR